MEKWRKADVDKYHFVTSFPTERRLLAEGGKSEGDEDMRRKEERNWDQMPENSSPAPGNFTELQKPRVEHPTEAYPALRRRCQEKLCRDSPR
jgi:hypothetical protein